MKKLIAWVSLLFICACNNPPTIKSTTAKGGTLTKKQSVWNEIKNEKHISSIGHSTALLKKFFSPDTIIHHVALWKPDPEARFSMKISDDGYCYTKIDTIFYIPPSDDEAQRFLILFKTMRHYKDGESSDCQECGANYGCASIVGDQVDCFKKNFMTSAFDGTIPDEVAIRKIGKDNYVLDITTEYQGSALYGYESLFDLGTLSPVFYFQNMNSSPSSIPTYSDGYDRTDKKLVCIPDKKDKEHDKFKLVTTHTIFNTKRKELETHISACLYTWNDEDSQYESAPK